jgi:DNA-binding LytR/AlgR family response regulator
VTLKLAIVENEAAQAAYLQSQLKQWSLEHQTLLDVQQYPSSETFFSSRFLEFDLVFLDIQLDGMDGLATAHRLRDQGFSGEIVFLTAFSEYVFDGYEVQALNYLLKPVTYPKVAKCLEYMVRKLDDDHYTFRYNKAIMQIPYSQIIYFSSANHHTQIVTTEGIYRQLEPMRNIFSYLPSRFLFCHRTVIVNMEHILTLKGRELILTNQAIVPVSHTYLPGIRSALLTYADSMR